METSVTEDESGDARFARDLAELRFGRLRLSQKKFAERYGLSFAVIRNAEQKRYSPHYAMLVLAAAIEMDPTLMAEAAKVARERWW